MAYITFQPSDHFNTKIYTGTGSTNNITGIGFQPDLNWTNKRTSGNNHAMVDVVRGVTKTIYPDEAYVEGTQSGGLTAFGTDGYTIGTSGDYNDSGVNYVSWNWRAANAQGSSNTDGSINTTYTSANTTAGFSISTYTGTGSNATVGHGLGAVPKMIIIKNRSSTESWRVYHNELGPTKEIYLDLDSAAGTSSSAFNDTEPTSSVFSVGTGNATNKSSDNLIAYCFAEKQGYSKFGSYTGNGNADGPFIYTGFRPAWIMIKRTDSSQDWRMFDAVRDPFNSLEKQLKANANTTESAGTDFLNFVSNGFKVLVSTASINSDGGFYVYMAFAEHPFVANDSGTAVPVVAR
jgi:hypothetical protein